MTRMSSSFGKSRVTISVLQRYDEQSRPVFSPIAYENICTSLISMHQRFWLIAESQVQLRRARIQLMTVQTDELEIKVSHPPPVAACSLR